MKQQSNEWFEARRGMITASEAHKLLGKKSTLETYAKKIAAELQGANIPRGRLNDAAEAGKEWESKVLSQLEMDWWAAGTPAQPLDMPFVIHPELFFVACSPDKCYKLSTGDRFGVEVKCIFTDKRWNEVTRRPDRNHAIQSQFCQWVTGLDSWFIVYAHITDDVIASKAMPERVEYQTVEASHDLLTMKAKHCWQLVSEELARIKKAAD